MARFAFNIVNERWPNERNVTENSFKAKKYLLVTEFEGRTVSYRPSFFLLDL